MEYGRSYYDGSKLHSPYPKGYNHADNWHVLLTRRDKLLKFVKEEGLEAKTLLDVGCATGTFMKICEEKGLACYGIEISKYAAKQARKRVKGVVWEMDIEQDAPLTPYDMITCFTVLEHLKRPVRVVKKLVRHLNPKGVLYVEMPVIPNLFYFDVVSAKVFWFVENTMRFFNKTLMHDSTHKSMFTHDQWKKKLSGTGRIRKVIKTKKYGFVFSSAFMIQKKG